MFLSIQGFVQKTKLRLLRNSHATQVGDTFDRLINNDKDKPSAFHLIFSALHLSVMYQRKVRSSASILVGIWKYHIPRIFSKDLR